MICNDFYKKLGNAHVNRNTIEKFLQIYINNYLTKQANLSFVSYKKIIFEFTFFSSF